MNFSTQILKMRTGLRDIIAAGLFLLVLTVGYTLVERVAVAGSWSEFIGHTPGETFNQWFNKIL